MGNPSSGGVFRLLACLGLLLLSARVAPVLAASATAHKAHPHSGATFPCNKPQTRVVVRVAVVGNVFDDYRSLYLRAAAAVEHYSLLNSCGTYEEQAWPFPLPIAVSYHEFNFTAPDYVQHTPPLASAGRPRPAVPTKLTTLLRRYGAGQWT